MFFFPEVSLFVLINSVHLNQTEVYLSSQLNCPDFPISLQLFLKWHYLVVFFTQNFFLLKSGAWRKHSVSEVVQSDQYKTKQGHQLALMHLKAKKIIWLLLPFLGQPHHTFGQNNVKILPMISDILFFFFCNFTYIRVEFIRVNSALCEGTAKIFFLAFFGT